MTDETGLKIYEDAIGIYITLDHSPQDLQSAIWGLDEEGWPSVIIHTCIGHCMDTNSGVVLVWYWYGTFVALVSILSKCMLIPKGISLHRQIQRAE